MGFEMFAEEDRQKERELLATYDLDIRLFKTMNLNINQIVPERNCFRLETDKGFFCLKKMNFPLEDMHLTLDMAGHLKSNNFHNIFGVVHQPSGDTIITHRDSKYYLTQWMDGRDSDYLNMLDIKESIECLARFHKAAEGFRPRRNVKHRRLFGQWRQGILQKLSEIEIAKEKHSENCSDESNRIFTTFLTACEKDAVRALDLLDKSSYYKLSARDEGKGGFIHHDYGLHNILHTFDGQTYIGGLESCALDIRMHDLGHFIFRLMRRRSWDLELAMSILGYYNEIFKLEKEDYEALAVYLTLPQDFKQLHRQHYIAGKEVEDTEELDKINIESEYNCARRDFLDELSRYVETKGKSVQKI